MNQALKIKLANLPKSPGVYFHKNSAGEIIYVGKAAVLNNRVRQYFQNNRLRDTKTELLIAEIKDVDWIETASETEALFLEAEMVRRYMPRYNILLRDDKSTVYIRINLKAFAPSVTLVRRPFDDGAEYFGPFFTAGPVNRALRYIRRTLPFSTHTSLPKRACLDYHLGLCPGPETATYDRQAYLRNLKKLILYIHGNSNSVARSLETAMRQAAKNQDYEQATTLRNQLNNLKMLQNRVIFGDRESQDLSKDQALVDLANLLSLAKPPRRIEGFDISHLQATNTVASMVVFVNGATNKTAYRKFKMRLSGNDDFLHMYEVIHRRLQSNNLKQWGTPDLILIDGGRGQLSAAIKAINEASLIIPVIGLAKKYEEIVISKNNSAVILDKASLHKLKGSIISESDDYINLSLSPKTHVIKLLQRIRDESHRFAFSYHTTLAIKQQKQSSFDSIIGIGPVTKKRLIKTFGSINAILKVSDESLIKTVGKHKATLIRNYFKQYFN